MQKTTLIPQHGLYAIAGVFQTIQDPVVYFSQTQGSNNFAVGLAIEDGTYNTLHLVDDTIVPTTVRGTDSLAQELWDYLNLHYDLSPGFNWTYDGVSEWTESYNLIEVL